MEAPKFAIGIDLGTSNCVVAYQDLRASNAWCKVLSIRQIARLGSEVDDPILPSFLYLSTTPERRSGIFAFSNDRAPEKCQQGSWVIGTFARYQASFTPERVIHSAKSWLCHAGIDRSAPVLPWGTEEISSAEKLSPVDASAAYLRYLRAAWQTHVGDLEEIDFDKQKIVITVPASFDEDAQRLTLDAARIAGYGPNIQLLEEPKAAFYAWLASTRSEGQSAAEYRNEQECTILVCDVGGGTSDFSLFSIRHGESGEQEVKRLAVSAHLLLGGDNIDRAIASLARSRLEADGLNVSNHQAAQLLMQARELKELALREELGFEENLTISVTGDGSSLFSGARSVKLNSAEIGAVVLDGFFPRCDATAKPISTRAGLFEWGLPYAKDSAITRHLAEFLDTHSVDAVLFAGGTFTSPLLRERVLDIIGSWQGLRPRELTNSELSFAVARGAVAYGALRSDSRRVIRGGYPRSIYLAVSDENGSEKLLCVLPRGSEEGRRERLPRRFSVTLGRPVVFRGFNALDRGRSLGSLSPSVRRAFTHYLHYIIGEASRPGRRPEERTVAIETELTETGLLTISLVELHGPGKWELRFALRRAEEESTPDTPPVERGASVATERIVEAKSKILHYYGGKKSFGGVSPKGLLRELEGDIGVPKEDWNVSLLRDLWKPLSEGVTRRARSLAHETVWLSLAGFLLRPGYGSELDRFRIDEAWRAFELGLSFPNDGSAVTQWHIMWRRVAGGLDRARQQALFASIIPRIKKREGDLIELFRLASSLERIAHDDKIRIVHLLEQLFIAGKVSHVALGQSLGHLLSRVPLYAEVDTVLPQSTVKRSFTLLSALDWREVRFTGLRLAFILASRRTGDPSRDIDDELRREVIRKLERSGGQQDDIRLVSDVVPVEQKDQSMLFGEALPLGLRAIGD